MAPPRQRRGDAPGDVDPAVLAELAVTHLLCVPDDVPAELVADLVRARVPRGGDLIFDGQVALGRHSRLVGPYQLTLEESGAARVPLPWTTVYAFHAPVEREDPPIEGVDDRDGFAFAFPRGLPWREEGRGLHLIVALARRLRGAVRTAEGELVTPDPDRAVDFVVHSPFWIEPEVLRGVVAQVLPSIRLDLEGLEWQGPPDAAYSGGLIARATADDPLTPEELDELHALADAGDMAVLAAEDVIDAYALIGEVADGYDGAVEVLVHLAEGDEPQVAGQPWAGRPFVSYEIRWIATDPAQREQRVPEPAFAERRARAQQVTFGIARAVVEASSGLLVDEDGFWVDHYTL